jgi:hypothetical protein
MSKEAFAAMMNDKPTERSVIETLLDKRNEWAAEQPSLSAQFAAMFREGVKDIRSTVMETFLGSPELGGEAGAPGNPTMQQVTKALGNVYEAKHEIEAIQPENPQIERGGMER